MFPTPVAGKTHMIARLKGDGSARPVLIASHADVVGVERDKWTVDPFAGVIKDGYVYGRGAIDFKGGIAVFAEAVMRLARNKIPLKRDVIFMVEADEEAQPYNTTWLAREHWDKMDCEFALNEGGWIIKRDDGKVRYVSISTADKTSISLVLTAHGTSTHSSMPRPDQAIFRLSKAHGQARRLRHQAGAHRQHARVFSHARENQPSLPCPTYFYNLVNSKDPQGDRRSRSRNLEGCAAARDHAQHHRAGADERGIPQQRDPRFGRSDHQFPRHSRHHCRRLAAEIKRVIADPEYRYRLPRDAPASNRLSPKIRPPRPSSTRRLRKSANTVWPGVPVTPYLFQAGTDASAWRSRGVPVYGIYPYPISNDDLSRMHGNDERVPVASLDQGVELIYQTLLKVAAK